MVDLALELHFDDLTALVVDVGANDQAFLAALDAMADGNDISRLCVGVEIGAGREAEQICGRNNE